LATSDKNTRKLEDLLKIKISGKFVKFLSQGVSPEKLALTIALGAVLGYFPVLGVTTFACVVISLSFRLNLPAMLLANYSMYPVQFLLLIPLLRLGEFIFQVEPIPLNLTYIADLFANDFFLAIRLFGLSLLRATVAWVLVSLPAILLLFIILKWIFKKTKKKMDTEYSEN
jgi:uncharacterized protein (DUF2062 family)